MNDLFVLMPSTTLVRLSNIMEAGTGTVNTHVRKLGLRVSHYIYFSFSIFVLILFLLSLGSRLIVQDSGVGSN